MLRLIGTLSCIWLVLTISMAQPPSAVLDTTGQALERGVEYYIVPETNQSGGGLTLIDRNGSCPFYVGQDANPASNGIPVTFTPFFADDTIIRESRDFTIAFSAATKCVQSTAWNVGETDPETQRRFIATGEDSQYGGYFRIVKNGDAYNFGWCPTDVCNTCRFICGSAGPLTENGKTLLALDGLLTVDGPVLPVVFKRA